MTRTLGAAVVGLLAGCATAPRPLHGPCGNARDCQPGQVCMAYAGEAGMERTCELRCETDADCPPSLECQRQVDGPPRSCQPRIGPEGFRADGGRWSRTDRGPGSAVGPECVSFSISDERFLYRQVYDGLFGELFDCGATEPNALDITLRVDPSVATGIRDVTVATSPPAPALAACVARLMKKHRLALPRGLRPQEFVYQLAWSPIPRRGPDPHTLEPVIKDPNGVAGTPCTSDRQCQYGTLCQCSEPSCTVRGPAVAGTCREVERLTQCLPDGGSP